MSLNRPDRPLVRTGTGPLVAQESQEGVTRTTLPVAAIVADDDNRKVVEDDEFEALCDSLRVSGLLQPVQVWRQADGTHRLIDGERRWRAAGKVGLTAIPCDVWPTEADRRRIAVAALALNEHRKAHGCIHVARRLRDLANENGFSQAEVAKHTGLPLDRVKNYSSLILGSEDVHKFLEKHEIPLKLAAELVRYERATNEARARRLMQRHLESPLTVQELITLRKRDQAREQSSAESPPGRKTPLVNRIIDRLESVVRRDPSALAHLEDLARRLGYQLLPATPRAES
jgi:ParB family chromosome partitioning protein